MCSRGQGRPRGLHLCTFVSTVFLTMLRMIRITDFRFENFFGDFPTKFPSGNSASLYILPRYSVLLYIRASMSD